jgi:RNase H-fold protein (predicted Holliday junction resolvase)
MGAVVPATKGVGMSIKVIVMKSLTFSGWKLQGRKKVHGMDVSIENRKGSVRRGVDKDGHEWATKMHFSYGYIRGTVGKDKDHLDCYLGPDPESRRVFIIHQNDPVTGNYDEDKVMLLFSTPEEAKAAYLKQYDRPGFFGEMDETDIDTFKEHALDKKNHGKKLVIKKSRMDKLIARRYPEELAVGIKVEMEHTDDPEEAKKIAMDHLAERPDYYKKLLVAGLVDEKEAIDEAKRQGLKKSHEWQNHKYIKKVGNKYFYTEDEIRNFRLQKRPDGFYYMDETKITNDPEKARMFEEKVREHKSAERGVSIGDKVQIKTDHRGSVGRGIVGVVKEMGDDFARVMDAAGRMFRVPTTALVFARSIVVVDPYMVKSDDGKNHLVTRKIIVTRKGSTFQTTTHVNPDKDAPGSTEKKKIRYVVKKPKAPVTHSKAETDVTVLSREIDARERQIYGINFGKVPEALEKHGVPASLPFKMYSGALRKVMDEKHDMTKEQVLAVQEAMKNPVAVLHSATEDNRLVVVTDVLDNEGRPVICAIIPKGNFYGRDANIITSMYGRNNFATFMENQKDRVIESDKERLDGLLPSVGRKQYPGALTGEPSKEKYTDDGKIVKAVRCVVSVLQKARKSPKLVPEKRMVMRDGRTFQTTVWILPGESGPAQGGLDFDAEPKEPKEPKRSIESAPKKINQKEAHEKEKGRMSGKNTDATLDRTRHDVMFDRPYTGKTGAKLLGYNWPHYEVAGVDKRGEDKIFRYSDWSQADVSRMTGRKFVHRFIIERTDGEEETLSAESAAVALGISEQSVRTNAVKLLEQQIRMDKKKAEAEEEASKILSMKWYKTPAEAVENTETFPSAWIRHKDWGEKARKNPDFYRHYEGAEEMPFFFKGPDGYVFINAHSETKDILEKQGIKPMKMLEKDVWDENGKPV